MTSRREQAEWRRERLLDAALTAFVAKGVDRATIKDIAHEAQVTPGLLYHYFDSKDALVRALLSERGFLPDFRQRLSNAAAADRPAAEVLPGLLGGFQEVLAANAGLVTLFFNVGTTNDHVREVLRALVWEGQGLLADYLRSRVEAGELRAHDSRLAAHTLLAAVAAGHIAGVAPDPHQLTDLLLRGVLS